MQLPAGSLLVSILTIIFVDVVLSGDNAVVIALAVKRLRGRERVRAILLGSGGAVILRVGATFFATQLLHIQFVKLAGGLTILWIAVRLLGEASPDGDTSRSAPASFWRAIWYIMAADVTMSLDNILAIAQVAHGSAELLIFGLGLSIPLMLFTSGLLASLMDRFPVIVYIGAALLGKIGAEMMLTDQITVEFVGPALWVRYLAEAAVAVAVLVVGKWMAKRSAREPENAHIG